MKKSLMVLVGLGAAAFAGYELYSSREAERLIAERRAQFSGYRIEQLEDERLLVLHSPDGGNRSVLLADLRKVFLYRLKAADSTNKQNTYFWVIDAPPMPLSIPYFSVEPTIVVELLKRERREVDIEWSLRRAHEFERDEFDLCTIWSASGSKQERGTNEYGYRYCAPHEQ